MKKCKKIHYNKYDYSKVEYKGYYEKIKIICPIHGEFEQLAYNHLQGKGCPRCKTSKLEIDFEQFLITNNIGYIYQYRPNFLKIGKSYMSLDFYLPKYNIAIECQGLQHFLGKTFYSENIKKIFERDKRKFEICKLNNIKILYYTNLKNRIKDLKYFGEIYFDKIKLLNAILNEQ